MSATDWVLTVITGGAVATTYWYRWGGQDRYNVWQVRRATRRHPSAFGGCIRWKL